MKFRLMSRIVNFLLSRYIDERFSFREKQKARISLYIVFLLNVAALFWALLYNLLGYPVPAFAPEIFIICSILTLIVTSFFRMYRALVQLHIFYILILPVAMHILLGNIYYGSLVILWGALGPIGSVFLTKNKKGMVFWICLYLFCVISLRVFEKQIEVFSAWYLDGNTGSPYTIGIIMNFFVSILILLGLLFYSRKLIFDYHGQIENVLFDILPRPIAEKILELSDDNVFIANQHLDVSIVFIKFSVEKARGNETGGNKEGNILYEIFKKLDKKSEELGIFKIKTVSEIYLSGTGLFEKANLKGIIELSKYAIDITKKYNKEHNSNLKVSIGINSGDIVAGVIGKNKKIYDIWGDTVNLASRMASTQYHNQIVLSDYSYKKIKDIYGSEIHKNVFVKGKGSMTIHSIRAYSKSKRYILQGNGV